MNYKNLISKLFLWKFLSVLLIIALYILPILYQFYLGWIPINIVQLGNVWFYGREVTFTQNFSNKLIPILNPYKVWNKSGVFILDELNRGNYTFRVMRSAEFYLQGDPRLYEMHISIGFLLFIRKTEWISTIPTDKGKWIFNPTLYFIFNNKGREKIVLDSQVLPGPFSIIVHGDYICVFYYNPQILYSLKRGQNNITVILEFNVSSPGYISFECGLIDLYGYISLNDKDYDLIADAIDIIPISNLLLLIAITLPYLINTVFKRLKHFTLKFNFYRKDEN